MQINNLSIEKLTFGLMDALFKNGQVFYLFHLKTQAGEFTGHILRIIHRVFERAVGIGRIANHQRQPCRLR